MTLVYIVKVIEINMKGWKITPFCPIICKIIRSVLIAFSSFNRKNHILFILAIVLFYGLQNVCFAQAAVNAGNDDTKHKRDGYYLRLTAGFGGTAAVEDYPGDESTISGGSGTTTIGFGYAIREYFCVNLDLFRSFMPYPDLLKINGEVITEEDAEVTISNLGLGLTYYIMSSNFYLSGSIGPAVGVVEYETSGTDLDLFGFDFSSLTQRQIEIESDIGYGINVAIGKEWWVSDNWAIGVAGQLFHTVLPFEESDLKTTSFGFGILFSGTFNYQTQ